tara:strand:+ start:772 stop:1191 length:420 start_codon:yes stop_codon:yes gene_type:complete
MTASNKQKGGSLPSGKNAIGRSSFSFQSLTNWLRGSFNIFTSRKPDPVNNPKLSILERGTRIGDQRPFPLLEPLGENAQKPIDPNPYSVNMDHSYGTGAKQVSPPSSTAIVGGGKKKRKTLRRKPKKGGKKLKRKTKKN